jgi:hypothetical protein
MCAKEQNESRHVYYRLASPIATTAASEMLSVIVKGIPNILELPDKRSVSVC